MKLNPIQDRNLEKKIQEMWSQKTQNKMLEISYSISKQILQLKDRKSQIVLKNMPTIFCL